MSSRTLPRGPVGINSPYYIIGLLTLTTDAFAVPAPQTLSHPTRALGLFLQEHLIAGVDIDGRVYSCATCCQQSGYQQHVTWNP
jgi:hypothetical protein